MAYEFTKLSEVLDAETVSDECNVIVEDGGEIKKTAKSNIGKAQVQADWNQTDPTQPDYIKNKLSCDVPYQQLVTDGEGNVKWEDRLAYDNRTVLIEQTRVTNANAVDGPVINPSFLVNGTPVTVNIDGKEYNATLEEGGTYMIGTGSAQCYYHIGTHGGINLSDHTTFTSDYPFFVVINEGGTCMVLFDGESAGTEHTFGVYAGEIKQIDPKYIKDMYYTKTISGSDGPIIAFRTELNTISPLTLSEPLIVDASYTVNVGDDKCKTTCTTDGEHLFIVVSVQGSTQGSLIVDDPINNPLIALWNGAVTNKKIEIVRESQEKVKQIDPKYIPATTVIVNITDNEDGTYSADKTFNEVKALIDSGFNVKCRFNMFEAPCIVYTTENTNTVIGFEIVDVSERFGYIAIITPDRVVVNEINVDDLLLPPINNNYGFLQAINGVWGISPDIIIPSSTSGSSKNFKITVDDSGTITATEV